MRYLTLILLTWGIWWAPNNASKGQMGFTLTFKGLIHTQYYFLINIKRTGYRILIFRPYKGVFAKTASPRVPHPDSYYTFISRFLRWLFWDTPGKKVKIPKWLTNLIPASNVLVYFSVFFFAETLWWVLLPFFPQLLEHHAVWFEDQFEKSNNFEGSEWYIFILGSTPQIC